MTDAEIISLIEEWQAEYPGKSPSSFARWLRSKGHQIGYNRAKRILETVGWLQGERLVPRKVREWEALAGDGKIVKLRHTTYDVDVDWRSAISAFIKEELPPPPRVETMHAGNNVGVLSITDPHVGALAWEPEVGNAYDTKRAVDAYSRASEKLVGDMRSAGVGHVLYIVGNDLLHIDGFANSTTKGTPQDTDTRWQYAFRRAKNMVVATIERIREFANVDIVIAPGNHDRILSWTLGEVIAAYYKDVVNVVVDNTPRYRKYKRYERLLFGITHGDGIKPLALPAIMATEAPSSDWANTTWREWYLGHMHRRREFISTQIDEERGIRMRYLPSLAAQDRWHYENGYSHARAAEAHVYDPLRGVQLASYYFFM